MYEKEAIKIVRVDFFLKKIELLKMKNPTIKIRNPKMSLIADQTQLKKELVNWKICQKKVAYV